MSNKTIKLAESFVDLVLMHAHEHWNADKVQILFDTVSAAGFKPKKIVLGKLLGHYRDQDGSSTGETYPINGLCPFKVISGEDKDDYLATGWLDSAFRRVAMSKHKQEDREELVEVISTEIRQSVPLEPIQLTPEGDLLREYPPSPTTFGLQYFVKHTTDKSDLKSCVGVHEFCNGWMDLMRVTETHNVIVCRRCHLRVLFPKEVKTYGDLRQALATKVAVKRVP